LSARTAGTAFCFTRTLILAVAVLTILVNSTEAARRNWLYAGGDRNNTRQQEVAREISADNVRNLQVKWVTELTGNISATPAVQGGYLYVTDWGNVPRDGEPPGGSIWKIDTGSGEVVWSRKIADYTGIPGDFSRNTPAIAGDKLLLGNQAGREPGRGTGALLFAVDKNTGDLVWINVVDLQENAGIKITGITQSPVVFGGQAYVGITSFEELFAIDPAYPCCSFRGNVVAVDVETGEVLWRTYMVPEDHTGAAVWSGMPVADPHRNLVYATTGNNYSVPDEVLACVDAAASDDEVRACMHPDNHFDSIVALDRSTGELRWAFQAVPFDVFTPACLPPFNEANPSCPAIAGEDLDFGQGPVLFRVAGVGQPTTLIGAGQKSGDYWALDPESGALAWHTKVGPRGTFGGMVWDAATDARRIYTAVSNSNGDSWELPSGEMIDHGFWSALDAATGEIVWQTPVPDGQFTPFWQGRPAAQGPVTVVADVVFAGSLAFGESPNMFALDARTGEIVWSFAAGSSVNAGPAVVDGVVYWGSGYDFLPSALCPLDSCFGVPGNRLFAFEVR
jgi:polyvinyl alcohol dehydrogenase (cytochrome)